MNGLTPLQLRTVDRLDFVGLGELADRATTAWSNSLPFPCALTPAERATMEGASLCEDFKMANREAREAQARNSSR